MALNCKFNKIMALILGCKQKLDNSKTTVGLKISSRLYERFVEMHEIIKIKQNNPVVWTCRFSADE